MRCLQELNSEQLTQEMMKDQPIIQVFLQTFNYNVFLFQSSVDPLSQELQGKTKQLYSCCLNSTALGAIFCFTSLFSPLSQTLVCFQSPPPLCFLVVFYRLSSSYFSSDIDISLLIFRGILLYSWEERFASHFHQGKGCTVHFPSPAFITHHRIHTNSTARQKFVRKEAGLFL